LLGRALRQQPPQRVDPTPFALPPVPQQFQRVEQRDEEHQPRRHGAEGVEQGQQQQPPQRFQRVDPNPFALPPVPQQLQRVEQRDGEHPKEQPQNKGENVTPHPTGGTAEKEREIQQTDIDTTTAKQE
jgi:hypothetical protein